VRSLRDIRDAEPGHDSAPAADRAEQVEQDRDQRTSSAPPSRVKALIDAFFDGEEDSLVIDRDAA